MTRVQDAGVATGAVKRTVPPAWHTLASQVPMPVETVARYDWLRRQPVVSDRQLAIVALAVLQDESDDARALHSRATGVLYRTAKMAIEGAVSRLWRFGRKLYPTHEDAITAVDDVVMEAMAKTTARTGGEWVTYIAMRVNGSVTNALDRDEVRLERTVSLNSDSIGAIDFEAVEAPGAEAIERVVMDAIQAVTTTDNQRCALEALFAVGRYRGMPGDGNHHQAEAARVSGLSQQRISVLRSRLKAYLYERLDVPDDGE